MNQILVLSILSDDKPGVVEALANIVSKHDGNWLESRMSHLAGKFAGILQVQVPDSQSPSLQNALSALKASHGIEVVASVASASDIEEDIKTLQFSLMGNDRPGIIRELSQAFASHHINLDELQTNCTSMPWSGDPMFTAHGLLHIPTQVDVDDLSEQLDEIADELGVDIELGEVEDSITE